ncbi:hypothetical protein ACFPK5_17410 [Streptomyces beijiangensis]|uniref:hypothetical protein n=1 Tax=Streptomyces beijiangensis TaxID=163361 RepID=UPI0031E12041
MAMTVQERVRATEEAVGQLRVGLGAVGVVLPSLRMDPVSAAGGGPDLPLVDLGRCSVDVALRIVAVLHEVEGVAP